MRALPLVCLPRCLCVGVCRRLVVVSLVLVGGPIARRVALEELDVWAFWFRFCACLPPVSHL